MWGLKSGSIFDAVKVVNIQDLARKVGGTNTGLMALKEYFWDTQY